ncbi:MAG: hypothetical protein ACI4TX_03900 [Christensenellales bacterium]
MWCDFKVRKFAGVGLAKGSVGFGTASGLALELVNICFVYNGV